jgi:frataxin-like iron-binding protein CyaY
MKRQMITMVAIATFLTMLAVASVHAQNAGDFAVSIPFEFAAAGKTLPAGDYYLRRTFDNARVVIRLESKNGSQSIYLATHAVQNIEIQNQSKLVFNKYGEQAFLTQVWMAGRSTGEEMNKTGRERVLQREMARRGVKPEGVTIEAKAN